MAYDSHMLISGLSGNEMYCLHQLGFAPGNIVVGNSVYSLGLMRTFTSGLRAISGGELENVTELISEGRHSAMKRLEKEAISEGARGIAGVTSELRSLAGYQEFLAVGSSLRKEEHDGTFFSTACSGQDLFCQIDSGYAPMRFVIGNVAYALGVGRGLMGAFRTFAGGEVKEFSDLYNHTRHIALERLEREAAAAGANSVVDVVTNIFNFGPGVKEMLMVGTASFNPLLGKLHTPVTSELTGEELWNLTNMGYVPVRLVLGTSVYALGFTGGLGAFFKGLGRGELDSVTRLIYEARENCLEHLKSEAQKLGANEVIGTKVYIYELGAGFVEVMAIGTAIRKEPKARTRTEQLPPQAIVRDRDTFFDAEFSVKPKRLSRTGD